MVSADEEADFLIREARTTLEALAAATARAPRELRPLLAKIRENLFEPGFTVAELERQLGLVDNELLVHFHRAMGITPARYLRQARLETAARLLRNTPLTTEAIAWLVGYSDSRALRRAFKKWSGYRPEGYVKVMAMAASINRLAAAFTASTGAAIKPRTDADGGDVFRGWTVVLDKQVLNRVYAIGSLERLRPFAYRIARLAAASGPHIVTLRFEDGVLTMRVESVVGVELSGDQYRLVASVDYCYGEMFGARSA